jgi:hypothetical protein
MVGGELLLTTGETAAVAAALDVGYVACLLRRISGSDASGSDASPMFVRRLAIGRIPAK